MYGEFAVRRLQQIITLRKLRIPLKKIDLIFNDAEQFKIVEVFQESLNELDNEDYSITNYTGYFANICRAIKFNGTYEYQT